MSDSVFIAGELLTIEADEESGMFILKGMKRAIMESKEGILKRLREWQRQPEQYAGQAQDISLTIHKIEKS